MRLQSVPHTGDLSPVILVLCLLLLSLAVSAAEAMHSPVPPGAVIDHSPASSGAYIGSPSLAVLPDGSYVASHDLFGPGTTNDQTLVFGSSDRGRHWRKLARVGGQWWSTLFWHRDALYLIGTSRENGFTVIRRSEDGGRAWTTPRDSESGLLLADGRYHCAPVPVVAHQGRLWRAMENLGPSGGWASYFRAFMMSVPEDADLLHAGNWTFSERLGSDPSWLGGRFGGWLEGNAVVGPHGGMLGVLRVDSSLDGEKAAIIHVSPDGRKLSFDPAGDLIPFPGGAKKFTIRSDPETHSYWSLANYVPPERRRGRPSLTRNTLALLSSGDLRTWRVRGILLQHPDDLHHGFQYVDWLFEGSDIIAVCRTAFGDGQGGAHNQHDANYLTFHRFRDFRGRALEAKGARGAITRLVRPRRGFYTKQLTYRGIPIQAPEVVEDEALYIARERVASLLQHLPKAAARLRKAGVELHIIGRNQMTSDLPEHREWKGKPYDGALTIDERTRGVGGLLVSCGEENLLRLEDDRYLGRDICRHEFAHALFSLGLPEHQRGLITEQYKRSLSKGLWRTAYAATNVDEFFAELTMWYFGTRGDLGHMDPAPTYGREGLRAYDTDAFELLDALYKGRLRAEP